MSNHLNNGKAWIIGAGNMARAYAPVLKALRVPFIVIGRGEERAAAFTQETGVPAISGGLDAFLAKKPPLPSFVISAVQVEFASETLRKLLEYGVKYILAEKPAGLTPEELQANANIAKENNAIVNIAYNRRFYASTITAERLIAEDGGIKAMSFEFTELWRVISQCKGDVSGWFYANSTHVCDLAFYLGGVPRQMACYQKRGIDGYTSTVSFAGAGITTKDVPFTYQANYLLPGRWGVEVLTSKRRLILRPMEQLQVWPLGSFVIEPFEIDDALDKQYKPGLYLQVKTFMENPVSPRFLTLAQQAEHMRIYRIMHEESGMECSAMA